MRVFVSSVEVEIFDSNFEFKFLEFSCRISNSPFSFRCSIRFLEFQFSIRVSIRVSNASSLIFRVEFVVEICRRNFRFVALFDFSNFALSLLSNSTSRISIRKFHCSIRLLEIDRQIRLLEFRLLESSPLTFEFVLIYSTSRTSIRMCRRNCCLRAEFFI